MRSATLFALLSLATGTLAALRPRQSDSDVCFLCPNYFEAIPSAPPYVNDANELVCPYNINGENLFCEYLVDSNGALDGANSDEQCTDPAQPTNFVCADSASDNGVSYGLMTAYYSDGDLNCEYGVNGNAELFCAYDLGGGGPDDGNVGACPAAVGCVANPQRRSFRRADNTVKVAQRRKMAAPRAAGVPRAERHTMDTRAALKKRAAH